MLACLPPAGAPAGQPAKSCALTALLIAPWHLYRAISIPVVLTDRENPTSSSGWKPPAQPSVGGQFGSTEAVRAHGPCWRCSALWRCHFSAGRPRWRRGRRCSCRGFWCRAAPCSSSVSKTAYLLLLDSVAVHRARRVFGPAHRQAPSVRSRRPGSHILFQGGEWIAGLGLAVWFHGAGLVRQVVPVVCRTAAA